jgi:hypothetical protein
MFLTQNYQTKKNLPLFDKNCKLLEHKNENENLK